MKRRRHAHAISFDQLVPHEKKPPVPSLSPLEAALFRGREAKRLGRPEENPHSDFLNPNDGMLAAEWKKGFGS